MSIINIKMVTNKKGCKILQSIYIFNFFHQNSLIQYWWHLLIQYLSYLLIQQALLTILFKCLLFSQLHVLGKFDFKINVIRNGLEKDMNFSRDNKLVFWVSFWAKISYTVLLCQISSNGRIQMIRFCEI